MVRLAAGLPDHYTGDDTNPHAAVGGALWLGGYASHGGDNNVADGCETGVSQAYSLHDPCLICVSPTET